jgi:hypothetical protein
MSAPSAFIAMSQSSGNVLTNSVAGDLIFCGTSNTQKIICGYCNAPSILTVTPTSVGINNSNPSYTLDVSGTGGVGTQMIGNPLCAVYYLASNFNYPGTGVDVNNVWPIPPQKSLWSNVSAVYGNLGSYSDPMDTNGYITFPVKGIYRVNFSGQAASNIAFNQLALIATKGYGVTSLVNYGTSGNPLRILSISDTSANMMTASFTGPFMSNDKVAVCMRVGGYPVPAINNNPSDYTQPLLTVSLLALLP